MNAFFLIFLFRDQNPGLHYFLIFTGFVMSLVAGIISFLITYNEMTKHFASRNEPLRISLKTALVTFLFFLAVSLIIIMLI